MRQLHLHELRAAAVLLPDRQPLRRGARSGSRTDRPRPGAADRDLRPGARHAGGAGRVCEAVERRPRYWHFLTGPARRHPARVRPVRRGLLSRRRPDEPLAPHGRHRPAGHARRATSKATSSRPRSSATSSRRCCARVCARATCHARAPAARWRAGRRRAERRQSRAGRATPGRAADVGPSPTRMPCISTRVARKL